ncbi:MAG: NRDE family protein [Desulfobacterales bacterium]
MCLILLAYNQHPEYQLVFAANRDEFYDRPTRPLGPWKDIPEIVAGRDLKCNGTWLGINRSGHFAAVTNYRDPLHQLAQAPTRGLLVSDFLSGSQSAATYLQRIAPRGRHYNGFNLLIGDSSDLWYYSNRGNGARKLHPGLYGISNHLLDTPWPKVKKGKRNLRDLLTARRKVRYELLLELLEDNAVPPDEDLPQTGVGLEWERTLSPLFISSTVYGTRSSSILLVKKNGRVTFVERTFNRKKDGAVSTETRKFSFVLKTT